MSRLSLVIPYSMLKHGYVRQNDPLIEKIGADLKELFHQSVIMTFAGSDYQNSVIPGHFFDIITIPHYEAF